MNKIILSISLMGLLVCNGPKGALADPVVPCEAPDSLVVIPEFTALASSDTDRVTFFDSNQSSCYAMINCVRKDLLCDRSWNFGGSGQVVGGNGSTSVVYQYNTAGNYSPSLTLTESISNVSVTVTGSVTAEEVEIPLPSADFASTVNGATVTLTAVVPLDVIMLTVFWGDRFRSQYTYPLQENIAHTYMRVENSYNIRVKTIDSADNKFNYTVAYDNDLHVYIPSIPNQGVDNDNDNFTEDIDCNDNNANIYPAAPELCDGIDNQCPGNPGYGIIDEDCPTGPHATLTYADYPAACLGCHDNGSAGNHYDQVWHTTHYQWVGTAEDMVNQIGSQQGKLTNAVNSYCINILGDWPVCGSCHIGRGIKPGESDTKANIDCLVCHNEEYATQRTRLPDGSMGVANPTASMVQNIHVPTRTNCLMCHAKAGGGDAVKRGDLSLATINNADANFDVHMNTAGSDLSCQSCHVFQDHKVIGKGSDLRPTDDLDRGSEVACTTCHATMALGGHASATTDRHVSRGKIACQVCHIPTYAKVATETHRDWLHHHDGTDATTCNEANPCPGHPHTDKGADLIPTYKWWDRLSDNYLLGDDSSIIYDVALNTYPTSRPLGSFDLNDTDTKIYPFKYKTGDQPKIVADDLLVALDTFVYLKGTGNVTEAIESGLVSMGYPASEPIEWITTDTYQLLNHGVEPSSNALDCNDCHSGTSGLSTNTRMPFADLGYHNFRNSTVNLCALCHDSESSSRVSIHDRHVRNLGYDCTDCHGKGAPLIKPQSDLCNDCHDFESAGVQSIHKKHVKDEKYDCSRCHTF